MTDAFTTEVIGDNARLEALAGKWHALWQRCPSATPFQSPAWLIPWWRAFHPGALTVIAVCDRDRLVGLAPFYLEDGAYGRRLLPIGISVSDHLDVLLDPEFADARQAMTEAMLALDREWDRWELEELAPEAAGRTLPCPTGCSERLVEQSVCPVLLLPDTIDGLLKGLSRNRWHSLKTALNRAENRGGMEVTRISGEGVRPFLDSLECLHRARWQSRGEAGVLSDPRLKGFHLEAARGFDRLGVARFYAGLLCGAPVAALYGFSHRGRFYAYLSGFDPQYERESPGALLLLRAIETAIAEGASEFHFLRGRERYKYDWHPVDRFNVKRSFVRHA